MAHDQTPSSPAVNSAGSTANDMLPRNPSVSAQLQDWLASRSLSTTLSPRSRPLSEPNLQFSIDPLSPRALVPIDLPKSPGPEPKPEPFAAHNPSTPTGVIAFGLDATENLSCVAPEPANARWVGLLVVILVLPSALIYAFGLRIFTTIATAILAIINVFTDFWFTALSYPSDRALRRAYVIRTGARTALALRAWLFLATYLGLVPPIVSRILGMGVAQVPVVGALVVAMLPIKPLAALLHAILTPLARLAAHAWRYGALYVFLGTAVAGGYGGYRLIRYVDLLVKGEEARPNVKFMKDLAGLRAELETLRTAGGRGA